MNAAARRGKKRAIVAIGHQLLKEIYYVLDTGEPHKEIGAKAVSKQKSKKRECYLIKELKKFGYDIQPVNNSI